MSNAPSPPEQPARAASKWSALSQVWKILIGAVPVVGLLVTVATNWNSIFPPKPPLEAHVEEPYVEPMTREAYNSDLKQPAASAASAGGAIPRPGFGTSFAVYAAPAAAQSTAGRRVAVSLEEEVKHNEEESKRADEKNKEEAKRDEENLAREQSKAQAAQKTAEAHEQEEQKKEQEALQRAEESQAHDAAQAKAEQAKAAAAQKAAEQAHETVQAKKQEAAKTPTQQHIESGASPDQVENVLRKAGDPEQCREKCSLKPFVEKALEERSGNETAAAAVVHAVAASNAGAVLSFHVKLIGLWHRVVFLTYVLVQDNGQELPRQYWGKVPIKKIVPTREPESRWLECWLPVPPNSGKYHLKLIISDSQEVLDIRKTNSFE
jgi:hypothetical protein